MTDAFFWEQNGKLFVLEYFEKTGKRPRKYVFKLQDVQSAHHVYGFFKSQPTYDVVKNTAFKVLAGDLKPISSTVPTVE